MSKVAVQGHASGTGTLTISAPNTNSDYTLSLPASTGTMLNDQSDITAQVKTATNASGSAPIYACRAWVNFNGTGTVAIRGSGNVSSITDNATGNYTVNFTTAMPDANYAIGGMVPQNGNGGNICISALNAGSAQVNTHSTDYNSPKDMSIVCVDIFR